MNQKLNITIPVRVDTVERLENIRTVVNFLFQHGFQNISVLEAAALCNGFVKELLGKRINYSFIKDEDLVFHRTRYINKMVSEATTPYVAIWDTDVIVPAKQVAEALRWLETGEADFAYPYDKPFLDTTPIIRKLFLEDGKIETLEQNRKKMKELYAPNPLGGAFLANRDAYIKSGMENEDFYGWGMEDGERFYRWQKLGYKIKRVPGPLYHLTHGRGINSMFHNPDQGLWKRKETLKAKRMAGQGQNGID